MSFPDKAPSAPASARSLADTAPRLARFFNTREGFWLGLQDFALKAARSKLGERLDAIAPLDRAA